MAINGKSREAIHAHRVIMDTHIKLDENRRKDERPDEYGDLKTAATNLIARLAEQYGRVATGESGQSQLDAVDRGNPTQLPDRTGV